MKRYPLLLTFVMVCGLVVLQAQTTEKCNEERRGSYTIEKQEVKTNGMMSFVGVAVSDSTTRERLYGATIMVGTHALSYMPKANDNYLSIMVNPKDTIDLSISYMGYHTLKVRRRFENGELINVFLSRQDCEVAEIVVKGRVPYMVKDNDTLRFNAKAFKTLIGSTFKDLLQKFPGWDVKNNEMYYNGEKITKFYVNKEKLFNNQQQLVLENLLAEDIVNVEVYKDTTDFERLNKISHPQKENVANIVTKEKIHYMKNISANATLPNIAKAKDGEFEVGGSYMATATGEAIQLLGKVSNTKSPAEDMQSFNPSFLRSKSVKDKYDFTVNLKSNLTNRKVNKYIINTYPADNWDDGRRENVNKNSHNKQAMNMLNVSGSKTFADKSLISTALKANLFLLNDKALNNQSVTIKGRRVPGLRNHDNSRSNNFDFDFSPKYSKYLSNNRLRIDCALDGEMQRGSNKNFQRDTFYIIKNVMNVDTKTSEDSYSTNGSIGLKKDLGSNIKLSFGSNLSYSEKALERSSLDIVTGEMDTVNTYNYRKRSSGAEVYTGFNYYVGIFSIITKAQYDHIDQSRSDIVPATGRFNKSYNLLSYSLKGEAQFGSFCTTEVEIARKPQITDIENLRNYLDNRNQLSLKAGNPDLKSATQNSMTMNTRITSNSLGSLQFNVEGSIINDCAAPQMRFFEEDTYLPEYSYTAVSGASLTTYKNAGDLKSINMSLDYSNYFWALRHTVTLSAGSGLKKAPYFNGENREYKDEKNYNVKMVLSSSISRFLDYEANVGYNYDENEYQGLANVNKRFHSSFLCKGRVFKRIGTLVFFSYSKSTNSIDDIGSIENYMLNASMSYKLDLKSCDLTFLFDFNNLLNNKKSLNVSSTENYMQFDNTPNKGRNIGFTVRWTLKERR